MTAPTRTRWPVDREPFDIAVLAALASGILSVVVGFLVSLTAALIALAFAGWISELRRRAPRLRDVARGRTAVALGLLAGLLASSLVLSGDLALLRGPILASALLPLWWTEWRPMRRTGPAERP